MIQTIVANECEKQIQMGKSADTFDCNVSKRNGLATNRGELLK